MFLDKLTSKRYFVPFGIIVVLVGAVVIGLVIYINQPAPNQSPLSLPSANVQKTLVDGKTKLYASDQILSDLLFDLDIFFKQQGLNSDGSAQDFKYDANQSNPQKLQACFEFNYFSQSEKVASFTLIPDDPACFTQDPEVAKDIKGLHGMYNYVYAAELHR